MQVNVETQQMTAVVLAGDRTKSDALLQHSEGDSKAMINIEGQPMVRRVLNALRDSKVVQKTVLSGPASGEKVTDELLLRWTEIEKIKWLKPGTSPSISAYEAMQILELDEPVLLTTADHPLLTAEIVDAFGKQSLSGDVDVTVGLAPHSLVCEAFPGIKKTVLRFSDGEFCGCNLFAFLTPEGRGAARFWRKIEKERKKPLVMIGLLGWRSVIRYRLGLLSLDEALTKLGKHLGLRIRAVILPYPNAAIDVDSIADLDLVRSIVKQ